MKLNDSLQLIRKAKQDIIVGLGGDLMAKKDIMMMVNQEGLLESPF